VSGPLLHLIKRNFVLGRPPKNLDYEFSHCSRLGRIHFVFAGLGNRKGLIERFGIDLGRVFDIPAATFNSFRLRRTLILGVTANPRVQSGVKLPTLWFGGYASPFLIETNTMRSHLAGRIVEDRH
jgi:hypothetical protein